MVRNCDGITERISFVESRESGQSRMETIVFIVAHIDLFYIIQTLFGSFRPSEPCPGVEHWFEFNDLAFTADPWCTIAVPTRIKSFRMYQFGGYNLHIAFVIPRFQPFLNTGMPDRLADNLIVFLIDDVAV